MKKIEIFDGDFTVEQIKSNPNKIYVIPDNFLRMGNQPFRNLENIISLTIKKGPSNKSAAYYSNNDIEDFKKSLLNDINNIRIHLLRNKPIVLSSSGYGNIERIETFGKEIKIYLDEYLKLNLHFDNILGKKFIRIPSYNEIESAPSLLIDKLDYNTLNHSQVIGAILMLKKIGLTIDKEIKIGTLVKLKSIVTDDSIICRILDCYSCSNISSLNWSTFEICDINKFEFDKFQIILEFLCTINSQGVMKFNSNIFGIQKNQYLEVKNKEKEEDKKIDLPEDLLNKPNSQIIDILNQINSKLDILISNSKK